MFKESITTDQNDVLASFQIYIERNEKPNNYMTFDNDAEANRRAKFEQDKII